MTIHGAVPPGLTIVVPMAGRGERFRQAGYRVPKPLLDVDGRPMYACAVESLPLEEATTLVFVVLSAGDGAGELEQDVRRRYAHARPVIVELASPTEGQAVSVLRAGESIAPELPLLIHNADTAFDIAPGWTARLWREGCDGGLLVFPSDEGRWSYAREGPDGWVEEVREKQVISPWASTGTYWFRRGGDFLSLARARVAQRRTEGSEYYVAPLYNDLIAGGGRVRAVRVAGVRCYGTPPEYERERGHPTGR